MLNDWFEAPGEDVVGSDHLASPKLRVRAAAGAACARTDEGDRAGTSTASCGSHLHTIRKPGAAGRDGISETDLLYWFG